jgi:parallel beta-helix repeat protein
MQYALSLSTTLDVPFFSQRDPAWYDKKLDHSPYSIGKYGCALTSAAMVAKCFGYDTNPERLNTSLTEVRGLDASGILHWKKVEEVSDGKVEWIGWAEGNWSRIDQELSEKNPVIADVSCPLGNHFIVFIGKIGTDYYFLDPYDESRIVNKWPNGAHGEYTLNNLRIYHRGRQQLVEAIEELELAIIDSIDYDIRQVADSYALLATAAELTPWWRELARLALDTIHAVVGTVIEVGEFLTPKGANQVLENPSTCQQVITGVKDSKDILGGIAAFQGLAGLYRNADSYKLSFEAINTVEEVARQEYEVSGDFDRTANAAWLELWRPSTPNGLQIPLKSGAPLKEGSSSSVSRWVNGLKEVNVEVRNSFDDVINKIPDPLPADYPLAETITYLKNLKQQIRGGGYRVVKFKCVDDDKERKRHITLGMVHEGREATSLLYDAWMDDLDVQYTSTLHKTGETIMHVTTYGVPATGVTKKVAKGVSDLYEVIVHPLDALQYHIVKMNNDLVHETSNLWTLSDGTLKYLQYTWEYPSETDSSEAGIIYVDDDFTDDPLHHKWDTLQEGINDAKEDDTVLVYDGTYEENVKVNKRLTIRSKSGADTTIVQAKIDDTAFEVTADNVNISGFKVIGGISLQSVDYCCISNNNCSKNGYGIGIHLNDSNKNIILENYCSNVWTGIYIENSKDNKVVGNTLIGTGIAILGSSLSDYVHEIDESNTVNGKPVYYWKDVNGGKIPDGAGQVILVNCKNIIVENQILNGGCAGIEVAFSSYITLKNNNCSSNKLDGIRLRYSNNNSIANNDCCVAGIYLCYSNNNSIARNNCTNNIWCGGVCLLYSHNNDIASNNCTNNSSAGIHLGHSNNNSISNNNCCYNEFEGIVLFHSNNNHLFNNICSNSRAYFSDGIYLYDSNENYISNNICSNNRNSIRLTDSNKNALYLNNFINNTNIVESFNSANTWNSPSKITYTYNGKNYENYRGNYWDDYKGTDSDGDGIGDIPYSIDGDKDNYPLMETFENYI